MHTSRRDAFQSINQRPIGRVNYLSRSVETLIPRRFGAMVQPAAMAWPPKRSSTPGWRLATRSSASRRWKPAIERPEPLSGPSAPRAKTKVGPVQPVLQARRRRCRPRLRGSRGRTAPAAGGGSSPSVEQRLAAIASACSRMPASTSRRSRLMASSCAPVRRRAPGRR